MAVGPRLRAAFGSHERQVAELYRSLFVNLDDLADAVYQRVSARRILEVGCGEGALVERLASRFLDAEIVGIDINDAVGRLYRGRSEGVRFEKQTVSSLVDSGAGGFDLVIVADVLHHVPISERGNLLRTAMRALRPGGALVVKDWIRGAQLIHLINWLSDRFVTGDQVEYLSLPELRGLIQAVAADWDTSDDLRIAPWRNNVLYVLRSPDP